MSIIRRDMTMETARCPVGSYLEVTNMISVFYCDFSYGYSSVGEFHDFWEFVYVDKGTVLTITDEDRFEVTAGQICLHKPNEFHQHLSITAKGASVMILAFEAKGGPMDFSHCNRRHLSPRLREELAQLVERSSPVFESIIESGNLWQLRSHKVVDKRREQLFKNSLELFLLNLLLWDGKTSEGHSQPLAPSQPLRAQSLFEVVCAHMAENLYSNVSLEDLCARFGCGKTLLSQCFHDKTGMGPIHYFSKLKIDKAKELLDNTQNRITEVAYILGFSSPQYFARVFKRHLGIYPKEYVKSINKKKNVFFIPK